MSLCSESSATAPGTGGAELGAVLQRLAGEEPPLLWVGPAAADCARVRDAVRFAALEINEHLETYFDRREHALEVCSLSSITVVRDCGQGPAAVGVACSRRL